jgi:hypothetical protein
MYDIVTLEPEDIAVITAVNAIKDGEGAIPGPNGNFRLFVPDNIRQEGNGGKSTRTLVIVGHGSANSLSGEKTWRGYRETLPGDWGYDPDRVYVAACKTAGENGNAFLHGNIAREIKAAYPNATVWASTSDVTNRTQSGDWEKVTL